MKFLYTKLIIFGIIVCLAAFLITSNYEEFGLGIVTLVLITPFAVYVDWIEYNDALVSEEEHGGQ